jgi:hypothetical protein
MTAERFRNREIQCGRVKIEYTVNLDGPGLLIPEFYDVTNAMFGRNHESRQSLQMLQETGLVSFHGHEDD